MSKINTYRSTAKVVGIIYLAGVVFGIGGNIFIQQFLIRRINFLQQEVNL